ncbi:MAG: LysE family translocator [Rhodospirillales bacterium]
MPVEPATLAAFMIAAFALVVSPGPDTILILRYTLLSGRRTGFSAVAGVQLGLAAHTVLAALGVSLLIASSPVLFKAVAISGAGYLAWLGIQGFRGGGAFDLNGEKRAIGAGQACRDAFFCNLLNPKVIILFLSLLPNFIDPAHGDTTAQLITLAAVLIGINVMWQVMLPWAAGALGRWIVRPEVVRRVSMATGSVLLAFAAIMLYEHFG